MARFEFNMPDVGEGLVDVELAEWLVSIGDTVEENQPIAEVETDKAFVTMPAPATGKIVELIVKEGERVKVGSLLLVMETEEEPIATSPISPEVDTTTCPYADGQGFVPRLSPRGLGGWRPTIGWRAISSAGEAGPSFAYRKEARP